MAIDQVSKFVIAVHQKNQEEFLIRLQRLGVFHITRRDQMESQQSDRELVRLLGIIENLKAGAGKRVPARISLSREEYEQLVTAYDVRPTIERIESLIQRKSELLARERIIVEEIRRLLPWVNLECAPAELLKYGDIRFVFARFSDRETFDEIQKIVSDKQVVFQIISEYESGIYVLVAFSADYEPDLMSELARVNWESENLSGLDRTPAEVIKELQSVQIQLQKELENIQQDLERLTTELPRLKAKADALINELKRREVENQIPKTESTILLYGWLRNRDIPRLQRLVEEFGVAAMMPVEPEPQEQPPVALVNRRLWRPFELVLEMYQLPLPDELDPTWLIAPFFGIFFGLCITDVGYGLVLAALTLLLMRRLGFSNKLLGMILIGAVLTIPAGAMVGGWFGDLPDRLGVSWLAAFKNRLMWFDPMKEPLKFFLISIALGYIQLNAGILFEIADCLRRKQFGEGFLGQLPWFVLLNGIVVRLLAGRSLPSYLNSILMVLILLAVAAIIVFTQRERETLISQWLWYGLISALLIYFAQRLNWLSAEFACVRWVVLGIFILMLGYAAATVSMHRCWNLKRILLGILTLIGLAIYLFKIMPAFVPGLLGLLFYFAAPSGQRLLAKFVWGGYALYSATSYIGVVLSYIRLMALGMCTGGVAMAINVIAWMVLSIPIIGPVLALIVLLIGHGYNIAVNVLGAFVHSLRLQYVEFFPRFYTGGGEPFKPFREVNEFVVLKS